MWDMISRLSGIAAIAVAVFAVSAYAQLDSFDDTGETLVAGVALSVNSNSDLTNWAWEDGSWTDPGATCTYDSSKWIVYANPPLDTSTVGSQTITYTCTASDTDYSTHGSRTVLIYADEPPVITLTRTSHTLHEQEPSSSYLGASCTDAVDGSLSLTVTEKVASSDASDTQRTTTMEYTFSCTDSAGQTATASGTVTSISKANEPPVITLTHTKFAVTNQKASPEHLGASCTDATDGDISMSVTESTISDTGTDDDRTVVVQYTFTCTDEDMNTVTATGTVTERWVAT